MCAVTPIQGCPDLWRAYLCPVPKRFNHSPRTPASFTIALASLAERLSDSSCSLSASLVSLSGEVPDAAETRKECHTSEHDCDARRPAGAVEQCK